MDELIQELCSFASSVVADDNEYQSDEKHFPFSAKAVSDSGSL